MRTRRPSIGRFSTSNIWATSRCRRFPRSPRCRREATWGEWLGHLRALAALGDSRSAPVLAALAELEPMAPVGPVRSRRSAPGVRRAARAARRRRRARRYGAVIVAPTHDLRGLDFDVVIVPGLAERVFPKKLTEDPILPDAARMHAGPTSQLQQSARRRGTASRLRLAAGAARASRDVFLSARRPRPGTAARAVVLRARGAARRRGAPARLRRARRTRGGRSRRRGWDGRRRATPIDAIDDAEFDLAVLDQAWQARMTRRRPARPITCSTPTLISRGRCARGRGDGSSDGRRRTGWSIPDRRCARRLTSIALTRVPIRPLRFSISRPARIAFCSTRSIGSSRAKRPRRSR